ncbi:glycoside hydrolase family 15 protein [Actinomadura atramentaria]|uniref:glycoside hydrolase family 15 protein n=1 Tax=Actinomadura atramentaria TaxID=1990 RepID=UPI000381E131|nr:glycoside hydrolase family 15 protein [Actinomadura atramentaria]
MNGPYALREYTVLADGERGVLTGPDGDCAFGCVPSWESPAVFAGLLGGGGDYRVAPADPWRVWGGAYEDGTLIFRRRWVTSGGVVECREALARPAAPDRLVLLRRVRAVRGAAAVRVRLDPRAEFGARPLTGLTCADGVWTGRCGDLHLRFTGAAHASANGGLEAVVELREGAEHDLVLELGTAPDAAPPDPRALWAATEADWRRAVPDCADTAAPADARLAYAVLTGLTAASGGMAAAATTSLPERTGAGRDYDYRYAWIRDQCYAGEAVAAHGARPDLLDAAVAFVAERVLADGDRLAPAYTVHGDPVPAERRLDLPGYPGSDVVVGNHAAGQFQLDALGEALHLFATAAAAGRLTDDAARAARVAVAAVARRWEEPDAGIWETRPALWTHSRLVCVGGLRAAAAAFAAPDERGTWDGLAAAILDRTRRTGARPGGGWRRAPGDDRADAALLVPLVRDAVPPDDPRTAATVRAVRDGLTDEGFVYRYRVGDRPLGDAEGAFMLCGFLLALAEHRAGDTAAARARFERVRSGCGTTGLFTEEYDVAQRQLRANLPQGFVHAFLLQAAARLGPG